MTQESDPDSYHKKLHVQEQIARVKGQIIWRRGAKTKQCRNFYFCDKNYIVLST